MDVPTAGHEPVMLSEIITYLRPRPGSVMVDCTVGRGGHSAALVEGIEADDAATVSAQFDNESATAGRAVSEISLVESADAHLHKSPDASSDIFRGLLIGMDFDQRNLEYAGARLQGRAVRLFHANFSEVDRVVKEAGVERVDGIMADLGISTNQLLDEPYGLSFTNDMPLDMRLDGRIRTSARDIVNRWPEEKIADTLFQLADERYSRRIARKIVEVRRRTPINTTEHLAELVREVVPRSRGRDRKIEIHPATRTFLALRMEVNGEMANLRRLLAVGPGLLRSGGRIAIISFHSTEDRVVKQAFRSAEQTGIMKVLTSRPLTPTDEEIRVNPRARSAKMRVAEKI